MKITLLRYIIFILFFVTAQAGDKAGNGGDVLVCKGENGQINGVELLDLYEAREIYDIPILPNEISSNDPVEILNTWLEKLKTVAPVRAYSYKKMLSSFFAETEFDSSDSLPQILDEGPISIPSNCNLRQVAIQTVYELTPISYSDDTKFCSSFFELKKRYKVHKKLWEMLSPFNKAALILHEIAYRDYLMGNIKFPNDVTSGAARRLNATLLSADYFKLSTKEYKDWFEKKSFFIKEENGIAYNRIVGPYFSEYFGDGEANPYVPSFIRTKRDYQESGWFNLIGEYKLNSNFTARSIALCGSFFLVSNQAKDPQDRKSYPALSYGEDLNGRLLRAYFNPPNVPAILNGQGAQIKGFWSSTTSSGSDLFFVDLESPLKLKSQFYTLKVLPQKSLFLSKGMQAGFVANDLIPRNVSATGEVFCTKAKKWISLNGTEFVLFNDQGLVSSISKGEQFTSCL